MNGYAEMPHLSTVGTPRPNVTHVVTIPGTTFKAFTETAERAADLAKRLAKTTTPPVFRTHKRRPKAVPVVETITDWSARNAR